MKTLFSYIYIFSALALVLIGLFLRTIESEVANSIFALGLLFVNIYIIYRLIKAITSEERKAWEIIFMLVLTFMPFTLFARYQYHSFWDYMGIITVIAFLLLLIPIYQNRKQPKNYKILSVYLVFLVLTIPLLGIPDFHKSPRQLIPKAWYNRYDIGEKIPSSLPWYLTDDVVIACSESALALRKSGKTKEAITAYEHCLTLEKSPRFYFELAQLYAFNNEIEYAIQLMDSIMYIDSTNAPSYNNRGLMHYKLKQNKRALADFDKAISLDSGHYAVHTNRGLTLYFLDRFDEACQAFERAEKLGKTHGKFVNRIKRLKCK